MTPRIRVRAGRAGSTAGPGLALADRRRVRPTQTAARETLAVRETAREMVAWPEDRMYAHRTP